VKKLQQGDASGDSKRIHQLKRVFPGRKSSKKMKGNRNREQGLNKIWNSPVTNTLETGDQHVTTGDQIEEASQDDIRGSSSSKAVTPIRSLDHIEQPSDEDTEDQKETTEDKIDETSCCCCCKMFNRLKRVFKSKAKKNKST